MLRMTFDLLIIDAILVGVSLGGLLAIFTDNLMESRRWRRIERQMLTSDDAPSEMECARRMHRGIGPFEMPSPRLPRTHPPWSPVRTLNLSRSPDFLAKRTNSS